MAKKPVSSYPKKGKTKKSKAEGSKKQKKAVASIVKNVLDKELETKMKTYYSSPANLAGDGTLANAGPSPHDQFIRNNVNDIMRLLPFVSLGTKISERIGTNIKPLNLYVQGTVQINYTNKLLGQIPEELFAVIYVVDHVFIKQYTQLITGNDFNNLLQTGQSSTQEFAGDYVSATMPLAKQYYRLIKKKVIPLRYAGAQGSGTVTGAYSVANAHNYRANFSFSLTEKHLPAALKYPETGINPIAGQDDPNNYAPFMCVGYYAMNGETTTTPQAYIQTQYVTQLTYKDA